MAEAHQQEGVVLVLRHLDVLFHVAAVVRDSLQHRHASLVGPAVQRAPQSTDAGRYRGEQIRIRRTDHPHGRGAAILLMVGVDNEEQIERIDIVRVRLERFGRHREHHPQKILAVSQIVPRIDERLTDRFLISVGRDRRQLGQQAQHRLSTCSGSVTLSESW